MMEKQLLFLLLILMMVHESDLAIKRRSFVIVDDNDSLLPMTWSDAREACLSYSSDMFTLDFMDEFNLESVTEGMNEVWMGLRRDAQDDSAWHWINTTILAPTTAGDVAQSLDWSEEGSISHCAFLNSDSTWSSRRCDEKQPFFCSSSKGITYMQTKLSWGDARKFCQKHEGDLDLNLKEVSRDEDDESSDSLEKGETGWIGFYRVGGDTWTGIGGESVDFSAWGQGEPVTNDCGAFNVKVEKWQSYPCDSHLNAVCREDNLKVVTENKTWEEALEHCKRLKEGCFKGACRIHHKLLTIENSSDFSYVSKRIYEATTDEVWTGLRFLGGQWWWINGKPVNDEGMLPTCPKYGNHCGVVSKIHDEAWLTADCSRKLNFVCEKDT